MITRRTRTLATEFLLVFVGLAGAYFVFQFATPHDQYLLVPFAVPVLIAAYCLPSRGAIVTAALALCLAAIAADLDNVPRVPEIFRLLGFLLVSALAILLVRERRVSAELARTRKTLRTLIETMPAGVLVSDAQGTITLTNASAKAILGEDITGNTSGPAGRYVLLRRDKTPYPARDLPIPRAIEYGEPCTDVEIRVRREDGKERTILTGATPIRDAQGRVIEAVAVFQDVTERSAMEEALRASQESLARAQAVAHVGNWDMDLRTGQVRISDEIYRITGITPDALVTPIDAYLQGVHPDDRERVTRAVQETLVAGRPFSIDHRIVRPDGTTCFVHAEAQALDYADGQVIHSVGTVQDITERKLAEEERERLLQEVQIERAHVAAIMNSIASAIIYVDAVAGHVQANPAASQLFGHPFVPEEGLAQYLPQLRHPDGRPVTLEDVPLLRDLQERSPVHEELIVVRPNGEQVPVLGSAAAVRRPDGRVVGAVGVVQDISTLKEIERLREEWTSVIAHDLRQPTTVIMGYASLLAMEGSTANDLNHEVAHIIASARNLSKMTDDLVDVSRIEARHLELHRHAVDLRELVAMVVERMATIGASSGVHQTVQVDVVGPIPDVLADPTRIEQVLGNLLSNAAKYRDPLTEITVAVRQREDTALVSVTNHGPGIARDEITRIFSRYYRTSKSRKGRTAGLGLGLYIAKGIIEAHQGQIWVESIPGQTTTFFFTLPLAREEGPASVASGLSAAPEDD